MSVQLPPLPARDLDEVLAHTAHLWAGARGARFFLTGGTGFFGMWLLESFVHVNDTLGLDLHATVLTRDFAAFARKAPHLASRRDLVFHQGEVSAFAFPAGRFTHVIHAAADTTVPLVAPNPFPVRDAIVDGTRRVLEFAAQAGTEKFLLTSSGAVYGPQPAELEQVPEDFPGRADLQAGGGYGVGKQLSEEMCAGHARQYGYDCTVARCFAFVGPHLPLDAHFAIGNFIRDARRGGPVEVKGDGTPFRSYLYAADLAVWLWTILFRGAPGRPYNVGSADGRPLAEVAEIVSRVVAGKAAVHIAQAPDAGRAPARYVPSVERARQELGLLERVDLAAAVGRTCDWLDLIPVP